MSVFATRTRLISFRISEKEYEAIRAMTIAQGARSVSDFARSLAVSAINGSNSNLNNGLSRDLDFIKLRLAVQDLQLRLGEISEEFKRGKSHGQQPNGEVVEELK